MANTYTRLYDKPESEIREEIRDKWKSVTLEEIISDIENQSKIGKYEVPKDIIKAVGKIATSYQEFYLKESEEIEIK
tara:strand:- start:236 stop:466 length:231 start_codon:yes stop_codon:yes gene_type:complete